MHLLISADSQWFASIGDVDLTQSIDYPHDHLYGYDRLFEPWRLHTLDTQMIDSMMKSIICVSKVYVCGAGMCPISVFHQFVKIASLSILEKIRCIFRWSDTAYGSYM